MNYFKAMAVKRRRRAIALMVLGALAGGMSWADAPGPRQISAKHGLAGGRPAANRGVATSHGRVSTPLRGSASAASHGSVPAPRIGAYARRGGVSAASASAGVGAPTAGAAAGPRPDAAGSHPGAAGLHAGVAAPRAALLAPKQHAMAALPVMPNAPRSSVRIGMSGKAAGHGPPYNAVLGGPATFDAKILVRR